MKKFITLVLTVICAFAISTTALASEPTHYEWHNVCNDTDGNIYAVDSFNTETYFGSDNFSAWVSVTYANYYPSTNIKTTVAYYTFNPVQCVFSRGILRGYSEDGKFLRTIPYTNLSHISFEPGSPFYMIMTTAKSYLH